MHWLVWFEIASWAIRLVMLVVILHRRIGPTASLAWLTVVFFQPFVGLVLYLLLGERRLGRRRLRKRWRLIRTLGTSDKVWQQLQRVLQPELPQILQGVTRQAEHTGGLPLVGGNDVEILADTDDFIARLEDEIDAAEHHVHLLYYIFAPDRTGRRIAEACIRAAKRGVACRVLADAVGSWALFRRGGLANHMRDQGVQINRMLRVSLWRRSLSRLDLRNHRKLAIIDGRVAFAGSQNIVNAEFGTKRVGPYVDLSARFRGPIVAELQTLFLDDWTFETEEELTSPDILPPMPLAGSIPAQAVPTGPGHESAEFSRVLVAAVHSASSQVILTTPYLVLDEPTQLALSMAVDRGVDVHLVIPRRSDHPLVDAVARAYVTPLLEAGVQVHLHQAGLLHAKSLTVDDAFAMLGSANLDLRSFYLNFELSVLLYGRQITQQLRCQQLRYIEESRTLDNTAWLNRSAAHRTLEHAASLLSALL